MASPDHAQPTLPPAPEGLSGWPWSEDAAETEAPSAALPSIGIVVPSYNQGVFLEATLRSLVLQRYPRLTIVVMDGGSTDDSPAIIQRYAPFLAYWVSERDKGQSDAIHRGLSRLPCDIVGWLNSDDVLKPGALWAVGRYVAQHPDCAWLCGDGCFVDESATKVQFVQRGARFSFDALLDYGGGNYLAQPSVFFQKALYERAGGVNLELHYAMDLDLWLRMRKLAELHYLPRELSLLRQQSGAKTLRDNERAMREVQRVVVGHARGRPLPAQARARLHMRRVRARSASQSALHAYFDAERRVAAEKLVEALRTYPPVVSDRAFLRVAARLGLPHWLKARLLERP